MEDVSLTEAKVKVKTEDELEHKLKGRDEDVENGRDARELSHGRWLKLAGKVARREMRGFRPLGVYLPRFAKARRNLKPKAGHPLRR